MIKFRIIILTIFFIVFATFDATADEVFLNNDNVTAFSAMMVKKHGFTEKQMTEFFTKAKYLKTPAQSSDNPAEALDWITYSSRMITTLKIKQGLTYYKKHRLHLRNAQAQYGVPDYIIAGIMGIETNYGTFPLRYRAFDALASLAFFYPRRASYFQSELEALLVYSKKYNKDPFQFSSSYAGAIGMPQFMPSNMLSYAVDADLDGYADIINTHKDAIYSVGNYLKAHKWQKGKPIVTEVRLKGNGYIPYVKKNPCAKNAMTTVGVLKKAGVVIPVKTTVKQKVALFSLDTPNGPKYFAGFENLCAIFKYNPSLRYAMVINALGSKLEDKKTAVTKKQKKKTTK